MQPIIPLSHHTYDSPQSSACSPIFVFNPRPPIAPPHFVCIYHHPPHPIASPMSSPPLPFIPPIPTHSHQIQIQLNLSFPSTCSTVTLPTGTHSTGDRSTGVVHHPICSTSVAHHPTITRHYPTILHASHSSPSHSYHPLPWHPFSSSYPFHRSTSTEISSMGTLSVTHPPTIFHHPTIILLIYRFYLFWIVVFS